MMSGPWLKRREGERGFTVVVAVLIMGLLVEAGVALTYVTQNVNDRAAESVDVQKAYLSAQSGFDWCLQTASINGWGIANIANIEGPRTLPDGTSFTLSYDTATDTMYSTSTVGKATRSIRFPGISAWLPATLP